MVIAAADRTLERTTGPGGQGTERRRYDVPSGIPRHRQPIERFKRRKGGGFRVRGSWDNTPPASDAARL